MTILKVITVLLTLLFVWIIFDSIRWKPAKSNKKADDKDVKDMLRYIKYEISDREFELWTAKFFRLIGYQAETTKSTGDGSRDVILKNKEGKVIFVECKQYKDKAISRGQVFTLLGSMSQYNADEGIYLTTSRYSKYALECATNRMQLWDLDNIEAYLMEMDSRSLKSLYVIS